MRFDNLRTLVLNSNFMPVSVFPDLFTISVKVAISGYLDDKCEVIDFYDIPIMSNGKQAVHAKKGALYWPSVILYKNTYSKNKVMRLTKENLYLRDHFACVYCGDPLLPSTTTMDHYIPKSKGGKNDWSNMVAACDSCNRKKGAELPGKRWTPSRKPYVPTFYDLLNARKKQPLIIDDESWIPFLPKWETEIIVRQGKKKPLEVKESNETEQKTQRKKFA